MPISTLVLACVFAEVGIHLLNVAVHWIVDLAERNTNYIVKPFHNIYLVIYFSKLVSVGGILEVSRFLGKDAHIEVAILVGLKSGGHNEIFPWREAKASGHLPQVDEGWRACSRSISLEEMFLQVHLSFS